MFIVYSKAVDEEITEIVKKYSAGYTRFTDVQGEGNGEPQLGTHVWPGRNNCMMVSMDNNNEKKIVDFDAKWLRKKKLQRIENSKG